MLTIIFCSNLTFSFYNINTRNELIEVEFGLWPPSIKAKYLAIVYYAKILKNSNNKLITKTLKILEVNAIKTPKNNWFSEIKKLIEEFNLAGIMNNIKEYSIPQIK